MGEGELEIVRTSVTIGHLKALAEASFGDLVKVVVDVDTGIMVIGGTMHADEEAVLLDLGSRQASLWGVNLYPGERDGAGWLEFDSMINVRPGQGNRSREVEDPEVRRQVTEIVTRLVQDG